jgi:hypothetical protein
MFGSSRNAIPQVVIDCPYCNGVASWFGLAPPDPCGPSCLGVATVPTYEGPRTRIQYYDLRDVIGIHSSASTSAPSLPEYRLSDHDVARIAEQVADQIAKRLSRR